MYKLKNKIERNYYYKLMSLALTVCGVIGVIYCALTIDAIDNVKSLIFSVTMIYIGICFSKYFSAKIILLKKELYSRKTSKKAKIIEYKNIA